MKAIVLGIGMAILGLVRIVGAAEEEPAVYVVEKGDTLWGLSERFVRDPYYWPGLWEVNQTKITNPHFIYPGQRIKIYKDRIEIEAPGEAPPAAAAALLPKTGPVSAEAKHIAQDVAKERSFAVTGGEGKLVDRDMKYSASIVAISQNRTIAGEDDIVYVDLGREHGAKVGARYSVFRKEGEVRHPLSNVTVGVKLIPLGALQLTELAEKSAKAIITRSYREIGPGAVILPYRDNRRSIPLRASTKDFVGSIVETYTGNRAIAAGEICYLDLGAADGLQVGNMLYVVRDVTIDAQYIKAAIGKLPVDVIGALVVVDVGEKTSTALVVKSVDTIYRADRVEFRGSR
jgi:LysM repeat protein